MFATWNWPDSENKVGTSSGYGMMPNTDRSRSPPATSASTRPVLHKEHLQAFSPEQVRGEAVAAACAPSWSTGLPQCDEWLRTHIIDDEVLTSFSEIPERNRKTIVLKAMGQPKDNPVAWIAACVNNQRTSEMEKRLTSMASSPGGRSATAQSAGPSKAGLASLGTFFHVVRLTLKIAAHHVQATHPPLQFHLKGASCQHSTLSMKIRPCWPGQPRRGRAALPTRVH